MLYINIYNSKYPIININTKLQYIIIKIFINKQKNFLCMNSNNNQNLI
jgi:hypothetical protein